MIVADPDDEIVLRWKIENADAISLPGFVPHRPIGSRKRSRRTVPPSNWAHRVTHSSRDSPTGYGRRTKAAEPKGKVRNRGFKASGFGHPAS